MMKIAATIAALAFAISLVPAASVPLAANAAGAWQGMAGAISTVLLEEGFRGAAAASLTPTYSMEEITHSKKAGEGYLQGSPLFVKQKEWQRRRAEEASLHAQGVALWRSVFLKHPFTTGVSYLANVLLVVAVAYVYKNYKPSAFMVHSHKELRTESWAYHIFDLRDLNTDWPICCISCCCPAIRWADTIGSDNVRPNSFWPAFFVFFLLQLLGPATFGFSVMLALCLGIYCRQKIRRNFRKAIDWKTYLNDCIFWCCCPCCAIAQEAREVEKVLLPSPGKGSSDKMQAGVYTNNSNAN